jgi:hypothetical protein
VQVLSFVYNALSLLGTFFYLLEDAKCSRKRGTALITALQCMAGLACGGIVRMIARLQFCISRVIIGLGLFIGLRNEEALD